MARRINVSFSPRSTRLANSSSMTERSGCPGIGLRSASSATPSAFRRNPTDSIFTAGFRAVLPILDSFALPCAATDGKIAPTVASMQLETSPVSPNVTDSRRVTRGLNEGTPISHTAQPHHRAGSAPGVSASRQGPRVRGSGGDECHGTAVTFAYPRAKFNSQSIEGINPKRLRAVVLNARRHATRPPMTFANTTCDIRSAQ